MTGLAPETQQELSKVIPDLNVQSQQVRMPLTGSGCIDPIRVDLRENTVPAQRLKHRCTRINADNPDQLKRVSHYQTILSAASPRFQPGAFRKPGDEIPNPAWSKRPTPRQCSADGGSVSRLPVSKALAATA
ncbi:hypothetical protein [Rhodopila sp.]|uniref:hypothetical protein n=1 Tax=Rhodopila sp. TaxID=2480087 RepID=UPI003D0C741B